MAMIRLVGSDSVTAQPRYYQTTGASIGPGVRLQDLTGLLAGVGQVFQGRRWMPRNPTISTPAGSIQPNYPPNGAGGF
jgi:hypothetical protein